jgi:hypothetical protein
MLCNIYLKLNGKRRKKLLIIKFKKRTSTKAASFLGNDPTIEGETPTSLAPAIIASSLHPNLNCIAHF